MPAGASSPCLLCSPSQCIPVPYLSCAGAKGNVGLHKAPGCQHPAETHHCHRDPLHPRAPLPYGSAGEPDPHGQWGHPLGLGGQLALPHSPHHRDLAVTRAQPRHSLLCGSSLLAMKGKAPGKGQPSPAFSTPALPGADEGGQHWHHPLQPPDLCLPSTSSGDGV